ncbi:hypothetical protein XarbCFBP7408_19425 [Xanthomonas arboricola pv. guizotiae]|uniref:Uncharacterized protein n=1 Tax=Xanthomonas arboricola pv. guizotiae TaxID=487867 RepID=A0A2S6ZRG8_9XANT|nr:hypothetical protein XarbCFBP7409_18545 [Xanthomonas arboricola pv. guizotiae]PPU19162.1 hypothetical protein XarbCFBP7408_19425 [Xanthomonas arboricola pv. guizotiae]
MNSRSWGWSREGGIGDWGLGMGRTRNQESGIGNRESGIGNREDLAASIALAGADAKSIAAHARFDSAIP